MVQIREELMIVDCISDLHGHYPELEGGDLLIVAGDWTASDKPYQVLKFGLWVNEQKYKRKIIIAGNHDNMIQTTPRIFEGLPDFVLTYLCDSGTEFEGLKIWGSPWTKTFPGMNPNCKAFTVDTEEELAEKWALIPDDVDILVTHGPPVSVLDGNGLGSLALAVLVGNIEPDVHVFGHIHEGYGVQYPPEKENLPSFFEINRTIYVNASHVNEHYKPVNKPIRVIL